MHTTGESHLRRIGPPLATCAPQAALPTPPHACAHMYAATVSHCETIFTHTLVQPTPTWSSRDPVPDPQSVMSIACAGGGCGRRASRRLLPDPGAGARRSGAAAERAAAGASPRAFNQSIVQSGRGIGPAPRSTTRGRR